MPRQRRKLLGQKYGAGAGLGIHLKPRGRGGRARGAQLVLNMDSHAVEANAPDGCRRVFVPLISVGFDGTTRVCQVSLKSYLDGSKSQGCHLETVLVLALSSKSLG